MFLNLGQFPRLTVGLAKVGVCLRVMERLTIPSELLASTVRDIAQMGELGDMGSDLDAGVAVGIPALDALQMVLGLCGWPDDRLGSPSVGLRPLWNECHRS